MSLNFANTNSLWGSFLAEALFRLGVGDAVVSPGSRSAPLTYALALHPGIRAIPVLDERSASFFALGLAKKTRRPVLLVCTSGTAAAHFFPAIIEARESRVPLLVLTADRPPEMRDCASGQTIDQVKIFGHYPRLQAELALPEASEKMLAYLRQTLRHACERALWPVAGPVHLNVPFRDPLAPVPDASLAGLDPDWIAGLLEGLSPVGAREAQPSEEEIQRVVQCVGKATRPLIVAGPASPADPAGYVEAVAQLAARCSAPVLADVLSPVRQRGWDLPSLVTNYDFLLEREKVPDELPDLILRLGSLPTSKRLRRWLERLECCQLVVEEGDQNVDPLHGRSIHLRTGVKSLVGAVLPSLPGKAPSTDYMGLWMAASIPVLNDLDRALAACEQMFEGKVAWLLSKQAPANAVVFISNSTPVRDAEYFWQPREMPVEIFFNRGANGIDGIVSTAMGVASEGEQAFLVTGDLAFLHDQNGLLNRRAMRGGLTVLLINNGGGGIFRSLPIAEFDPPFEDYFLTPQEVDFKNLCAAHRIGHELVSNWTALAEAIAAPCTEGIRVLEIQTDARADRELRTRLLRGK